MFKSVVLHDDQCHTADRVNMEYVLSYMLIPILIVDICLLNLISHQFHIRIQNFYLNN